MARAPKTITNEIAADLNELVEASKESAAAVSAPVEAKPAEPVAAEPAPAPKPEPKVAAKPEPKAAVVTTIEDAPYTPPSGILKVPAQTLAEMQRGVEALNKYR